MTLPIAFKNASSENQEGDRLNTQEKIDSYVCNICSKNFHKKASFTFHLNSHNFSNNNLEDGKFDFELRNTCNICYKKFTAKKNLLKHLRDVHKNFSEAERMVVKKIKCPERNCEFLCRMMKELREHIEKCHKIKILKDTLEFPSESVFQKWKKEEESNTVSWFVTGRKKTTLMDGTKKQTLYCHRTGHYSPKGFGKYRMRSVGSCKIGVTCPAAMEVIESPDGGLTVIYYKTHLGHMQDVAYLKLSSEERAQLAEKIKQGFSFDAILDDVKESRGVEHDKKKRIHLLSKKDLYSIMRTANCNNRKNSRKDNEEKDVNKLEKIKSNKTSQENSSAIHNTRIQKTEGVHYGFNNHNVITSLKFSNFEENSSVMSLQKNEQELSISQTSKESSGSQIVILSPNIDCSSLAEIILLSTGEGSTAQHTILTHTEVPHDENQMTKRESESQMTEDLTTEEGNRMNKSNLHLQLKEKLQNISELLPESEFLTPRQFDLVNAKLNGILDIFNIANAKAKLKKQSSKKKIIGKNKSCTTSEKISCETEYKVEETVQLYENPFQLYAVFN